MRPSSRSWTSTCCALCLKGRSATGLQVCANISFINFRWSHLYRINEDLLLCRSAHLGPTCCSRRGAHQDLLRPCRWGAWRTKDYCRRDLLEGNQSHARCTSIDWYLEPEVLTPGVPSLRAPTFMRSHWIESSLLAIVSRPRWNSPRLFRFAMVMRCVHPILLYNIILSLETRLTSTCRTS